jgi:hypothetical protein
VTVIVACFEYSLINELLRIGYTDRRG